jgi:hypothetical protein
VVSTRDRYGAGPATFGHDGNPAGLAHIIDAATGRPLYKHTPCDRCGIATFAFTPEPQPCAACKLGRVARNENELAVVAQGSLL